MWHGVGAVMGGLVALALLWTGYLLLSRPRAPQPASLQSTTGARAEAAPQTLVVDGVLDTDEVDIASKLPGRLGSVLVKEGDAVNAGQLVAVLQAEELTAKHEQASAGLRGAEAQETQAHLAVGLESDKAEDQIKQAQAGVQAATAGLGMANAKLAALEHGARPQEIVQAQQAVEAAQAAFNTAKLTYSRVKALADEGVVARQKADEAELGYHSAQAALTAAQAKLSLVKAGARQEELDAARAQVRQAEAGIAAARGALQLAVDGRAMVDVRRQDVAAARQKVAAGQGLVHEVAAYQQQTRIVSPISGVVSQRIARGGEIIAPGYAILTVARTDQYWVDVYVDEAQFAGHHVGEAVEVEIPAVGKRVPGAISRLLPAADFATKRATNEKGSFDARAVQLRVTLQGDVRGLASGLTARVRFAPRGGR
jgi:HlyD family secretion protein